MKLNSKASCRYENGYILAKDGEVLNLDWKVKAQLEKLDKAWQEYSYLQEQEPFHAAPSLEGFHRITADEDYRRWDLLDAPDTPALDAQLARSLAFRDDCIKSERVEQVNATAIRCFTELLDFCSNDSFFEGFGMPERIDCVSLGNPLELKADDVMAMLMAFASDDRPWYFDKEEEGECAL